MQKWENECVRQANVILGHCTDSRYLNSANMWLAILYQDMGNYVKMLEHAEKITVLDPFVEGGHWKTQAYALLGRKEDSRKQNAENIYKALDYLQYQLYCIGKAWREEGKFEEAYACHRLFPDIYDHMVGDREDEMSFCSPHYDYEQCALNSMYLNCRDEAMDWLEKMVRHQRITAKNYNVITESKLPYLYGQELHYLADSYTRTGTLLPTLAWEIFDPIRETDRFKAILADAEAFEKGE